MCDGEHGSVSKGFRHSSVHQRRRSRIHLSKPTNKKSEGENKQKKTVQNYAKSYNLEKEQQTIKDRELNENHSSTATHPCLSRNVPGDRLPGIEIVERRKILIIDCEKHHVMRSHFRIGTSPALATKSCYHAQLREARVITIHHKQTYNCEDKPTTAKVVCHGR